MRNVLDEVSSYGATGWYSLFSYPTCIPSKWSGQGRGSLPAAQETAGGRVCVGYGHTSYTHTPLPTDINLSGSIRARVQLQGCGQGKGVREKGAPYPAAASNTVVVEGGCP